MAYIGLLDCNNFFVSCERLFRPDLRNRPTVVLSSNDGCVVARSEEVKALGIPMGIPYFKVKAELEQHGVAAFSGNLTLYRDISARVMKLLREAVGNVEQYSIDEAFFYLPESSGVLEEVQTLKHLIEQQIGVPVAIGVGKTKTIAKYACDLKKRQEGVAILVGESWQQEAKQIPMTVVWGVGARTSEKLRQHSIKTVADFLAADPARVAQLFGVYGERLRAELNEMPAHHNVLKETKQQSIMSTRSFKAIISKRSELGVAVAYHVEQVGRELRNKDLHTKRIRVMLETSRHGDWMLRGGALEASLPAPTADTRVLLKTALALVDALYDKKVPYKKVGVVVSDLVATKGQTASLFITSETYRENTLMNVIDRVNKKLGRSTITIGRTNSQGGSFSKREFSSPQYTTRWDDIADVKAR